MLQRKALIIECSKVSGLEPLPGAKRDAQSWRDYLLSNRAGAWFEDEITVLSNPSKSQVHAVVDEMREGYAFIAFSGHGWVNKNSGETMIEVEGGSISQTELIPKCKRATLIFDSCRGVVGAEKMVAFSEALRKSYSPDKRHRDIFDEALRNAEEGCCWLFGCAFNQAAQESKAGGVFTQAMIEAGQKWSGRDVYSLADAFNEAEKTVQRVHPQQTPEKQCGRRMRHFPFAVKP
jgi:hypothetical protein